MGQVMGSDMVADIGGVHSGPMVLRTARLGLAGIEGMAALAERAIRQVLIDHVHRHRLMRPRNLRKNLEERSPGQAG